MCGVSKRPPTRSPLASRPSIIFYGPCPPCSYPDVDSRGVQAGYDSLTKATGFSRKTIQRTVDRLIAKHYIEIETPADIYRRTSTVYRVFGPRAVLERLIHRGCTHIAKIGPGVAFVSPLSGLADHSRTIDTSEQATVVDTSPPTVDHS